MVHICTENYSFINKFFVSADMLQHIW